MADVDDIRGASSRRLAMGDVDDQISQFVNDGDIACMSGMK